MRLASGRYTIPLLYRFAVASREHTGATHTNVAYLIAVA
jgi:hypothetical protein